MTDHFLESRKRRDPRGASRGNSSEYISEWSMIRLNVNIASGGRDIGIDIESAAVGLVVGDKRVRANGGLTTPNHKD